MPKDRSEPAFPRSRPDGQLGAIQRGMSLRDYFAAKALQGFLANPDENIVTEQAYRIAAQAYEFADLMMKERSKKK